MSLKSLVQLDNHIYAIALCVCVVGLVGFYMYLVSLSIVNVVMNKETMQDISLLESKITELETQYIEAQHTVSQELAIQQGFVQAPEKVFLTVGDARSVVVSRQEP